MTISCRTDLPTYHKTPDWTFAEPTSKAVQEKTAEWWTWAEADAETVNIVQCAMDDLYNNKEDFEDFLTSIMVNVDKLPTLKKHMETYIVSAIEQGDL